MGGCQVAKYTQHIGFAHAARPTATVLATATTPQPISTPTAVPSLAPVAAQTRPGRNMELMFYDFRVTSDCRGCAERDTTIAQLARTAGDCFARWHWTLKLLGAMPRPQDTSWTDWLGKRRNALRGWDTSGRPPECPSCRRLVQVVFVVPGSSTIWCSTCWLESTGQTPTTTIWRQHAIVSAEELQRNASGDQPGVHG